ncbi:MAG: 50S ribosomal protein L18 [Lentisphaerae bacterium]|nr:50S ribosomal protein L18 [Lentisphaerota bacterium]
MQLKSRSDFRVARHRRVRRKISGTSARPRMAVFKSGTSLQVQLIDDEQGVTLAAARTARAKNVAAAAELGRSIAEQAKAKDIELVVVDRGGFRFHGRIKAIVDAAVEAGLSIGKTAEPAQEASREDNDA